MNIKDAERLTGISRHNIRFYEKEGLIAPRRNRENAYRSYSQQDITLLKQIKLLRMLDMPLEQIGLVLEARLPLQSALDTRQQELLAKTSQLKAAMSLCDLLRREGSLSDVDGLMTRMDQLGAQQPYDAWRNDYRNMGGDKMTRLEDIQKQYAHYVEITEEEFTDALAAMGSEEFRKHYKKEIHTETFENGSTKTTVQYFRIEYNNEVAMLILMERLRQDLEKNSKYTRSIWILLLSVVLVFVAYCIICIMAASL